MRYSSKLPIALTVVALAATIVLGPFLSSTDLVSGGPGHVPGSLCLLLLVWVLLVVASYFLASKESRR